MRTPRTAATVTFDMETGSVEVETPPKTAEQEEREAKWNQAAEEAFGKGRTELPQQLWLWFGAGSDKQRQAKGIAVPGHGQEPWFGYSRAFEMSTGERVSLPRGVQILWPQFQGRGNPLATVEPGDEAGELQATYHPGYPKGTRKNKHPGPRTRTFPEADGAKVVRKVRAWIQEQVDQDPVALGLERKRENAPREGRSTEAVAPATEMKTERRPRRRPKERTNPTKGGPFAGFGEAAVIDVETTGLSPGKDRIVEVGIARTDFSALLRGETRPYFETLEIRVNPGVPIPERASEVHGIRDEDVAEEEGFEEAAEQIRTFIGDRPVIGHNVDFDRRFLNAEFERAGVADLRGNDSYCTMLRFRESFPGEESSLDAVAAKTGRSRKGEAHGALEDALLTAAIAGNFYMVDNEAEEPQRSQDNEGGATGGAGVFWWIGIGLVIVVSLVAVAT